MHRHRSENPGGFGQVTEPERGMALEQAGLWGPVAPVTPPRAAAHSELPAFTPPGTAATVEGLHGQGDVLSQRG